MKTLRILAFTGGAALLALGFHGFHNLGDPSLLQGALTLGGGMIIAALFSLSPRWLWHGTGAIGVLTLLGAARSAPGLTQAASGGAPAYQATAFAISLAILVATLLTLRAERARLTREKLLNAPEDSQE